MRRLLPLLLILGLAASPAHAQQSPTYVIFFQSWSAALDRAALNVVKQAAGWAKSHPDQAVQVTGSADTTGGQRANSLLSQLRAQMVNDQLVTDGVNAGRIQQSAVGSIPGSGSALLARRVQVTFTSH